MLPLHTFSMVAYDPQEQAWGVAVASKFLAAGALVSWAKAGIGAIATQSYAKVGFGPDGLALLAQGKTAAETLAALLEADPKRESRQVGVVDAHGNVAAHTGKDCHTWAGHKLGTGFSCQGNILTGADVLDAMAQAYLTASGELADRLVTALQAGDSAGGDKRGKQSAAVLVVRPTGSITDHWDETAKHAFWVMIGNENLEERWNLEESPNELDRVALEYLRQRFGS